uniref:Wall-associated receptor kinase galacturonan-binding domain-containing protein n=1 Tax=Fagus sylvatica TaxID=28930 RepID=A0A2N9F6V2_FAGSY
MVQSRERVLRSPDYLTLPPQQPQRHLANNHDGKPPRVAHLAGKRVLLPSLYFPIAASCKPPLLQPVGSQKDMGVHEPMLMSSTDWYPSTIHGDSDLISKNKNDHTIIGNPTKYVFTIEFSFLDDYLVSHPVEKVENLGFGGFVTEAAAPIAKPNCKSSCGKVQIPFPFGIEPDCYLDQWFKIVCNETGSSAKAFLPSIDMMEVLNISIRDPDYSIYNPGVIRVNMPIISPSNCNGSRSAGVNMTGSPFFFSSYRNEFISVGCDNLAVMTGIDPMVVVGCRSDCNTNMIDNKEVKCSGFNCCQTTVPTGIQYLEYVPVFLEWNASSNFSNMESREELRRRNAALSYLSNGVKYYYYRCRSGYEGNPYLPTGCQGKL